MSDPSPPLHSLSERPPPISGAPAQVDVPRAAPKDPAEASGAQRPRRTERIVGLLILFAAVATGIYVAHVQGLLPIGFLEQPPPQQRPTPLLRPATIPVPEPLAAPADASTILPSDAGAATDGAAAADAQDDVQNDANENDASASIDARRSTGSRR
jgi:hypothetical protein